MPVSCIIFSAVYLVQPVLVLQLMYPTELHQHCFIELTICDAKKTRRRLIFSTAFKEITSNELHAQVFP